MTAITFDKERDMPREMTIGDWRNGKFLMDWVMITPASKQKCDAIDEIKDPEQWVDAYESLQLDFSAPEDAPDGIHKVYVAYHDDPPLYGVGAIIRDGMFVPEPTEAAVLAAACRTFDSSATNVRGGSDDIPIYIESFEWDETRGALRVHLGS